MYDSEYFLKLLKAAGEDQKGGVDQQTCTLHQ